MILIYNLYLVSDPQRQFAERSVIYYYDAKSTSPLAAISRKQRVSPTTLETEGVKGVERAPPVHIVSSSTDLKVSFHIKATEPQAVSPTSPKSEPKAAKLYKIVSESKSELRNSQKQRLEQNDEDFAPLRDVLYETSGDNSNRAVFVIPRRAYFDDRIVDGEPRNIVVILAEVHDEAFFMKSICACEVNGKRSKKVRVIHEGSFTGWVRANHGRTHRLLMVECLGFDLPSITNGSTTRLIYLKDGEKNYSRVETEKPLVLRDKGVFKNNSVFVCATLYDHPGRLHDWLRYQKTLGVDLVHLNVDISFSENAAKIYPFLNESLHNGFVKMEVWRDIVGKGMFYKGQITKYMDCLYRYIGIFEYGLFYDVDDFFNPVLEDHWDLKYYTSRLFANPKIGSVCFAWHQMQCAPDESLHNTLRDGNLTSVLSGYKLKPQLRNVRKCAHRLDAIVYVLIHGAERRFSGYGYRIANESLAYVAHNHIGLQQC